MDLLVAADDRTGALETAGALADAGCGPVHVGTVLDALTRRAVAVVDLGTRHVRGADVARRCDEADAVNALRHAHKIDSTLRGGWAAELVHRGRHRRVLLVPALPALVRTCEGGFVLVDGSPVHRSPSGRDVDHVLDTSRPAELLDRAGARGVVELGGADACARWLADGQGIAVCDATTDADVDELARRWAHSRSADDVLLAGTSAVVARGGRHLLGSGAVVPAARPALAGPVIVVRGSVHPAAEAQVRRLVEHGAVAVEPGRPDHVVPGGGVTVVGYPLPERGVQTVDAERAAAVAASLAVVVQHALDTGQVRTLVVLGGDTAAAVLGERELVVGGTLAPGTPWGRLADDGPLIVTRAGGFGGPDALVELLSATLAT